MNLTDECKIVTLNVSNFSLTLFECLFNSFHLRPLIGTSRIVGCEAACSLSLSSSTLARAGEKGSWLMFHPVQVHCALIGWNYCTGMHPLISPKALILCSKLFNSHIKTCKILLRPRQFLLNANTGDDQVSGGSDESHSCIHTGVGFK